MPTITGFLFDLDGTLIDSETTALEALGNVAKCLQEHAKPASEIKKKKEDDQNRDEASSATRPPLFFNQEMHAKILGTRKEIWSLMCMEMFGMKLPQQEEEGGDKSASVAEATTQGCQSTGDAATSSAVNNFALRSTGAGALPSMFGEPEVWYWTSDPQLPKENPNMQGDIFPEVGDAMCVPHFITLFHSMVEPLFDTMQLMPGVASFMNKLNNSEILKSVPKAVATSSDRNRAIKKLGLHPEVLGEHQFVSTTCGTDEGVKHGKPAPDIFFLAAERVQKCSYSSSTTDDLEASSKPPFPGGNARFVAFEDSPAGVKAGHDAGHFVVACIDRRYSDGSHQWVKLADLTVDCIEDSFDALEKLMLSPEWKQ